MIGLTCEFPHKGDGIMASHYCDLWYSLLHDSGNRGKIYNDFMVDKMAVIEHINNCNECRQMIVDVLPPKTDLPDFSSMDNKQFSTAIRELWKLSGRIITLPLG